MVLATKFLSLFFTQLLARVQFLLEIVKVSLGCSSFIDLFFCTQFDIIRLIV